VSFPFHLVMMGMMIRHNLCLIIFPIITTLTVWTPSLLHSKFKILSINSTHYRLLAPKLPSRTLDSSTFFLLFLVELLRYERGFRPTHNQPCLYHHCMYYIVLQVVLVFLLSIASLIIYFIDSSWVHFIVAILNYGAWVNSSNKCWTQTWAFVDRRDLNERESRKVNVDLHTVSGNKWPIQLLPIIILPITVNQY